MRRRSVLCGRVLAGILLASAAAGLAGCGGAASNGASTLAAEALAAGPRPGSFRYCHDHGCAAAETLGFAPESWARIRAGLAGPASDAAEERRRLAETVARFEQAAAAMAGTAGDRAGTFESFGVGGQLDCVDEAVNTTVLLALLDREGLLRWHRPGAPAARGDMLSGSWPHRTATIAELAGGRRWAVDSWFHDNGQPAEIVPLDLWRDGWFPTR